MAFPFITRSHHEDVVGRLEKQLADVQAERKAYLDTLAQLGFGVKFFAKDEAPEAQPEPETSKQPTTASPTVPLSRLRPSAIMRSMDAKKQREYEHKMGVQRKDQILSEVNAIIGDTLPQA